MHMMHLQQLFQRKEGDDDDEEDEKPSKGHLRVPRSETKTSGNAEQVFKANPSPMSFVSGKVWGLWT